MTTQVIIKLDKGLKEKALKKAKMDGLSFSDILQLATRAYVEGRLQPRLVEPERPLKRSVLKELKKISKDIQEGKNVSPAFADTRDAVAWLKKRK